MIEKFDSEKHGENLKNFVRESTYSAGFTNGQKKIDVLRQEGKCRPPFLRSPLARQAARKSYYFDTNALLASKDIFV